MLFTTLKYAVFFALAFLGSWALCLVPGRSRPSDDEPGRPFNAWPRLIFLLIVSYGFYAAWDWRYLPLIFGSSTVDFFLARAVDREKRPGAKRALLLITVALNLGFLGFFKYWNFASENVRLLLALVQGGAPPTADAFRVLLPPVGISFFTFESMSYVIDVYRGELEPHRSYFRYLLFVSFFPHLVAGPIVRPRDLLPQLERRPVLTREEGGEALFLIAIGLMKKLVLSDQLAQNLVDRVFERPTSFSSLEVLAAVYGYAAQIYCDFSGYTDIAIGSALLLGVRFSKNFDAPYKAEDLADFWRRWHISLSTWLRDYLYIPLGGNRGAGWKTYRNLMLTMLLGGLWHGASWTFVFWGFLHGFGLVVTRAYQRSRFRQPKADHPFAKALRVVATFHYVCLAWIFFRARTFADAWQILRQLALGTTFHPNLPPLVLGLLGVALASHYVPEGAYKELRARFTELPAPAQGVVLFLVAVVLHEAARPPPGPVGANNARRARITAGPAPAQGGGRCLGAGGLHEAASTTAVPFVYFQF